MSVSLNYSGTISIDRNFDGTSRSGIITAYNLEDNIIMSSGLFHINSNNLNFSMTNMHTSRDRYYLGFGAFGYIGEGRDCSGLSPTEEMLYEDFVFPYTPTSGNQIFYSNFESGSIPTNILTSGYGTGITNSGLLTDSSMEGSYCFGIQASNDASVYAIPSGVTFSGLTSGRTIFLVRNGTTAATSQQTTGFAFLRQGSGLTDNCYKVYITTSSTSTNYELRLAYGQMANGTTGVIDTVGTSIQTIPLSFFSSTTRNTKRNHWIIVEWEVDTTYENHVKIGIYHKLHSPGDTIESVRILSTLVCQHTFRGSTDGTGLYTTTTEPPLWISSTDGSIRTSIDCLYLETISNLTNNGLFNQGIKVFKGTDAIGSMPRANIVNSLLNNGTETGPEGSVVINATNPLISFNKGVYGIRGYGYRGLQIYRSGGSANTEPFISYIFTDSRTNNIKHGVFRIAIRMANAATVRMGFSFLRQGSLFSDNCYTVEFFRNGTNAFRVRIKKGVIITAPYDDFVNFGGSILGTSSDLSGFNDNGVAWIEVRWKVDSSMDIEVLYSLVSTNLVDIDSSPGNVDYKLSSVLSVTDSASPYITTNDPPVLTLITSDPQMYVHQLELRKAKLGN